MSALQSLERCRKPHEPHGRLYTDMRAAHPA
jgi:hypothetical protein